MFDDDLDSAFGDAARLAELVADTHALAKLYECRRLVIAAAWADAHADPDDRPERAEDSQTSRRTRAENEGFVQPGGAGTPRIAETCPAELGVLQQLSVGSARCLIADALDLRHRLPRLWSRVAAGEVHAWKARQVATRSRQLGSIAAAELDRLVCHQLELVSWARFERILDAAMLHVDPVLYGRRAEESRAHRDVWVGEADRGLRTLIIRACQGDTAVFLAAVNRVADLLADEGDEDPVGARRATAVGILGNPAAALDLLNRHTRQRDAYAGEWAAGPDPDETCPWDPASAAGWADPRSRPCHQPDSFDTDHVAAQQPPADDPSARAATSEEPPVDPWSDGPAGDRPAPVDRPAGPDGPATDDDARQPLLRDGGIELRPVTPAERDVSRPRALIVFHLTEEALRAGRGVVRTAAGAITVDELRQFLTNTDAEITVAPVLDPAAVAPIDAYEIPPQLRRAVDTRNPASVFPFGGSRSGRTDLDHTRPYRRGGPPGQTSADNLGPLTRSEHRAKTVGHWTVRQPAPGTYLWRSPTGWIALSTNQGTIMLGVGAYARRLWRDAGQEVHPVPAIELTREFARTPPEGPSRHRGDRHRVLGATRVRTGAAPATPRPRPRRPPS